MLYIPPVNTQYVSFLQQEIQQLEAELTTLEATSTPTTTPATDSAPINSQFMFPVTTSPGWVGTYPESWKAPAVCGGGNFPKLEQEGIDCTPPAFAE